ncbi:hypothetical protein RMN57_13340 [Kitasatospora sp. CM 4170]|uniref:Uncharacterized protein n=1 Tax=Kitasatospora aburaviensis TaxID=67265 RepID=A0ABW1EV07_9ACTN|nr:hypothetical protein [Kitasatospora sp. CM 4170]WNM45638.1 hypothetical protein RMN57_13340 [Kitasatospora sp. CM 4170]
MSGDDQAAYRAADERRRRGLPDSRGLTAGFAVSVAGLVVLAALLLAAAGR